MLPTFATEVNMPLKNYRTGRFARIDRLE